MSLCGLLRNRTGHDSPWFGVRSKRRLAGTKAARIDIGDIGAIPAHAVHERRESARQAGGLALTIRPSAAYCRKQEIARGGCKKFASELALCWRQHRSEHDDGRSAYLPAFPSAARRLCRRARLAGPTTRLSH
jgi:hypothetical protein